MSTDQPTPPDPDSPAVDPKAARRVGLMMLLVVVGGFVAFRLLSQPPPPASAEVAADPMLSEGRSIFLGRCATCHGNEGRGDGPLAALLQGPPVGNLSDDQWKHGDRPEQVVAVISRGAPGTRMEGWNRVLDPPEVRAVAAYVYHLAGRTVPDALRKSPD